MTAFFFFKVDEYMRTNFMIKLIYVMRGHVNAVITTTCTSVHRVQTALELTIFTISQWARWLMSQQKIVES